MGLPPEEVHERPGLGPVVAEELAPGEARPHALDLRRREVRRVERGDQGADGGPGDLGHAEAEPLDGLEAADVGVAAGLAAGEREVHGAGVSGPGHGPAWRACFFPG